MLLLTPELMTGLTDALTTLEVDPDVIADVVSTLQDSSDALDEGDFLHLKLADTSFGGSSQAAQLGLHHSLAQEIIADTILGVVADLRRFGEGVQQAAVLVDEADSMASSDLLKREHAADILLNVSGYSSGDRRNEQSRNENL